MAGFGSAFEGRRMLEFNRVPSAPWQTCTSAERDLGMLTGEPVIAEPMVLPDVEPVVGHTPYYDLMRLVHYEDRFGFSSPWAE